MPYIYVCRVCGCMSWNEEYRETYNQWKYCIVNEETGEIEEDWGDSDTSGDSEPTDYVACHDCGSDNLEGTSLSTEQVLDLVNTIPRERLAKLEGFIRIHSAEIPENCNFQDRPAEEASPTEADCKKCLIISHCQYAQARGWR